MIATQLLVVPRSMPMTVPGAEHMPRCMCCTGRPRRADARSALAAKRAIIPDDVSGFVDVEASKNS